MTHQYIGTKIVTAWQQEESACVIPRQGYAVKYSDGYISWSPKDVFEEAYRRTDGMSFGLAIEAIKKGLCVARSGWNGKGMWLNLQVPDENSKMSLPYIYMKTADDKQVPWLASQTDVLADDWSVVNPII